MFNPLQVHLADFERIRFALHLFDDVPDVGFARCETGDLGFDLVVG
ncbi:MAG: hypothetical protein AAFY12_11680 [Pseudomonadota bacterium]